MTDLLTDLLIYLTHTCTLTLTVLAFQNHSSLTPQSPFPLCRIPIILSPLPLLVHADFHCIGGTVVSVY